MRAHEISLLVSESGALAAWHGGTGEGSQIVLQRLDENDVPSGQTLWTSDSAALAYEPDLVEADGRYLVAWYERNPTSDRLAAFLAALDRQGQQQWRIQLGKMDDQLRNPVVRWNGERVDIAWIAEPSGKDPAADYSVWHQAFSGDGKPLIPARAIGTADADTWNLNAVSHGRRFHVTYDSSHNSTSDEIWLLTVEGDANHAVRLTADDGHASAYPDLQINQDGVAALVWFDEKDGNCEAYLALAPLEQMARAEKVAGTRLTNSPGETIGVYTAWSGETLGVAWSDQRNGQRDVFVQIFDAQDRPHKEPRNISASLQASSIPSIRAAQDGFLIGWNDYVITPGEDHTSIENSVARFGRLGSKD